MCLVLLSENLFSYRHDIDTREIIRIGSNLLSGSNQNETIIVDIQYLNIFYNLSV